MNKSLKILLIEDDTIEVMKFKRVISSLEENHKIIEAINGEEGINTIKDESVNPDLIVLDLNMPKMNGVEFLENLRNDKQLKFIPAVILSTSNNQKDLLDCYNNGVAGYIVKPLKYEDYVDRIKKLIAYWSQNELYKT